jgi:hypothetical protein
VGGVCGEGRALGEEDGGGGGDVAVEDYAAAGLVWRGRLVTGARGGKEGLDLG